MRFLLLALSFYGITACQPAGKKSIDTVVNLKGDKNFIIKDSTYFKIVDILQPYPGANFKERYILYPVDSVQPEVNATHFIPTPIKTCVIHSTTHLGYLSALNQRASIIGATNLNLYYDSLFRSRIENNLVADLGNRSIGIEKLIELDETVLFGYAIDAGSFKEISKLRDLGETIILMSEFTEQEPLKKAEWIKVFAAFYDEETHQLADSFYRQIENKYHEIRTAAMLHSNLPKVAIGYPWKGTWYVSGANTYQAQLIKDAGGYYVWNSSEYSQGMSIPLSFEVAFQKGLNADYWLNPGSKKSKNEIASEYEDLSNFKAFKESKIYTNYKRSTINGANDYWETGVVRPDLILQDLVQIIHLKDSTYPYNFYKQLE